MPNDISVIRDPARYARTLLAHGVPITLLIDLLDPPSSRAVYRAEAVADDVRREAARAAREDPGDHLPLASTAT